MCFHSREEGGEGVAHNLEQSDFDPRCCDVSCLTWAVGPCFARQLNLDAWEAGRGENSHEEEERLLAFLETKKKTCRGASEESGYMASANRRET